MSVDQIYYTIIGVSSFLASFCVVGLLGNLGSWLNPAFPKLALPLLGLMVTTFGLTAVNINSWLSNRYDSYRIAKLFLDEKALRWFVSVLGLTIVLTLLYSAFNIPSFSLKIGVGYINNQSFIFLLNVLMILCLVGFVSYIKLVYKYTTNSDEIIVRSLEEKSKTDEVDIYFVEDMEVIVLALIRRGEMNYVKSCLDILSSILLREDIVDNRNDRIIDLLEILWIKALECNNTDLYCTVFPQHMYEILRKLTENSGNKEFIDKILVQFNYLTKRLAKQHSQFKNESTLYDLYFYWYLTALPLHIDWKYDYVYLLDNHLKSSLQRLIDKAKLNIFTIVIQKLVEINKNYKYDFISLFRLIVPLLNDFAKKTDHFIILNTLFYDVLSMSTTEDLQQCLNTLNEFKEKIIALAHQKTLKQSILNQFRKKEEEIKSIFIRNRINENLLHVSSCCYEIKETKFIYAILSSEVEISLYDSMYYSHFLLNQLTEKKLSKHSFNFTTVLVFYFLRLIQNDSNLPEYFSSDHFRSQATNHYNNRKCNFLIDNMTYLITVVQTIEHRLLKEVGLKIHTTENNICNWLDRLQNYFVSGKKDAEERLILLQKIGRYKTESNSL